MEKLNKNLTSWDDHLDKKYGKIRTPTREKYEEEFEAFKIGVLIQEARKKQHLTQEQLANRAGTTKNYISRIENNASDIRLSTLIDEGVKETSKLVALAIRYRLFGELFQRIQEEDSLNTLGISIIPYRKGNHLLLTGSLLSDNKLIQSYELLRNDREVGTPSEEQISCFLKKMSATEKKSNLVIFTDNSTNLLHNLINLHDGEDVSIVHISDIDSIVLNRYQESVNIPHDGCYIKIDHNKMLLTTNGLPDISQGVPSPIYIEAIQNNNIDFETILKRIYFETFLHPSSFAKPKLPISLHTSSRFRLPNKRIFTEIQEVGFFI